MSFITKTKVHLHENVFLLSCLGPLVFLLPKIVSYLVLQSFDIKRHVMKVIPEIHRAH